MTNMSGEHCEQPNWRFSYKAYPINYSKDDFLKLVVFCRSLKKRPFFLIFSLATILINLGFMYIYFFAHIGLPLSSFGHLGAINNLESKIYIFELYFIPCVLVGL